MQRLGLCCLFRRVPIRFRTTTAAYILRLKRREDSLSYLSDIILHNIGSLFAAIVYCSEHGIGSFRITSRLFPLYTHPEFGYQLEDLPGRLLIHENLKRVQKEASAKNIRLTFHPDQFVVLSSPRDEVVAKSIQELEYHGMMAQYLGADVINLHAGGGYGDKKEALCRFADNFSRLSPIVQERLTLENDDRTFTPKDLLPVCRQLNIPFVYDVHHHRCLKDGWTEEEVTEKALATWKKEPLFHVSSPKGGWSAKDPRQHADFIDVHDLPLCWKRIDPLTMEVEAKAKEEAIARLRRALLKRGWKI